MRLPRMTLEEAIAHCEAIADRCAVTDGDRRCEAEHRKLAYWLRELRNRRNAEREDRLRLYIKVYADDEPWAKAEKIYQISGGKDLQEVVNALIEYCVLEKEQS